jgi:hypothetical protein
LRRLLAFYHNEVVKILGILSSAHSHLRAFAELRANAAFVKWPVFGAPFKTDRCAIILAVRSGA